MAKREGEQQVMEGMPEVEQFEGDPVIERAMKLSGIEFSVRESLSRGDHVAGTWSGTIVGVHHDEIKVKGIPTGELRRLHMVEVSDAAMTFPKPAKKAKAPENVDPETGEIGDPAED